MANTTKRLGPDENRAIRTLARVGCLVLGALPTAVFFFITGAHNQVVYPTPFWQVATAISPFSFFWIGGGFVVWTWVWNQLGVVRTQRWWKQNGVKYLRADTRSKLQRLEFAADHWRGKYEEVHAEAKSYRRVLQAVDAARKIEGEDEVAARRLFGS